MSLLKDLKLFMRSKSWQFVQDSKLAPSDILKIFNWHGNKLHYRPGTSDAGLIYEVLLRPGRRIKSNGVIQYKRCLEYWVPEELNPKVVFDIGGNVGMTSIYYSSIFPSAKIYTFEPVKRNYEILNLNAQNSNNIQTFNYGLGASNEEMKIFSAFDETNNGGFSIYSENTDVDQNSFEMINIRNSKEVMDEMNITNIDLIKIDTEGAEYDILRSMDPKILSNVKWIIGELHSVNDFKLLDYLSEWFEIDLDKGLKNKLSLFNACNKKIVNDINWK